MMGFRDFGQEQGLNWMTVLASGIVVLAASALTGCRFGNNVTYAQDSDPTGYYGTTASSLQYCVGLLNQPAEDGAICREGMINEIPARVGATMTDPVALITDKTRSDGSAVLMENTLKIAETQFPVFVEQDRTLSVQISTKPGTFWRDENCQSRAYYTVQGALTSSPVPDALLSDGSTVKLKGRISAQFQVIETLEGSCVPTLQMVQACYQDSTQCGEDTADRNLQMQAVVRSIFGPYIEAGALTLNDIPSMLTFAYKVSYE